MMKNSSKLIFLFSVCLAGCTMYPKYKRPEPPMQEHWRISAEESKSAANLDWWKQLGDLILDAYIIEALTYNQNLQQAVYTVDEFIARLGIVSSELYPQLSLQAGGLRNQESTTLEPLIPENQALSNAYNLILNFSYEVDIWGKIRSASHAARAEMFAEVQNRRAVVLTLVTAVAATYVELRRLDEQLRIAKETLKLREEALYLAEIRFELGLTSKIEVEQAKSELDFVATREVDFELQVALTENALSVLLGKAPGEIKRGLPLTTLTMAINIPTYMPSELLNQRPDILASEQLLIAANANIGVARAKFFPQISLIGAYGTETSQLHQLFKGPSNFWEYGLSLLQEVFTGGRLTSGLKLTKADKMIRLYNYESTVLQAFQDVNDALVSYQKFQEILQVQKDRVDALAEYFYLATLRYQNGQIDYLTYMDAERQLFSAEIDYAQFLGDTFKAMIGIYKSLGGGWVVDADRRFVKHDKP